MTGISLVILIIIALLIAWALGLFTPICNGVVVHKETKVTYHTYGQEKAATSIPFTSYLLIDMRGRFCRVSQGVWANVQAGDAFEGKWRSGGRAATRHTQQQH